jgi:DNA (cytosine-5)-methyltransferase 1
MLVLSLFPGIGLLDMAFEAEGFCVVRGPDVLWGGDIHTFHPPAGKFSGVIGGPPCQAFSRLRHMVEANGFNVAKNLIPEFERVVSEAAPDWFVMENVPDAPMPSIEGYSCTAQQIRDVWVGGATERLRRFTFGSRGTYGRFQIETLALHGMGEGTVVAGHGLAPGQRDKAHRAVVCDGRAVPVRRSGSGKDKSTATDFVMSLGSMYALQGLPEDFLDHAPFTVHGKRKVVGNGVPLPMGRAVARAVKKAIGRDLEAQGLAGCYSLPDTDCQCPYHERAAQELAND